MKQVSKKFEMPQKSHRIDFPIPVSDDKTVKLYLLWSWSFEDAKLYLQVKKDKVDDPYFEGELSATKPILEFELDLTMPNPIPHLKIENSKLILGFPDDSKVPNSLTFKGNIVVGNNFSHTFKDLEYTFNW